MSYDLLVVGGGIQGAAVARDAALRGLRVLLLERGDLASGTSSRSSKLIHGGIRYLETGQFRLVREALRERARLLELAPEYVRMLPFMIPHYRGEGRPRVLVRIGLDLYAFLASEHLLAEHRTIGVREALAMEPSLRTDGLLGASLYMDAQMDDALLNVAVALDAERAGATVLTYHEVTGLSRITAGWRARYRDTDTGHEGEIEARCVVNAAGPWAEQVRALAGTAGADGLRRTRGTHVVVQRLTRAGALLLSARRDGRVFFVLPWGSYSLIGTTDVDDDTPPERIAATASDVRYLLEEAARAIPALASGVRPLRAFAGLRSLARGSAARPWANSREHRILEDGSMLSLIGGKYTTHRSLAERVVDRVVTLTAKPAGPCLTRTQPIPGRADAITKLAETHSARLRAADTIEISEAEVVHAVKAQRARHLEDVLERRTRLWLDAEAMRRSAETVSQWIAPHLKWEESTRAGEVESVIQALDREAAVLQEAFA